MKISNVYGNVLPLLLFIQKIVYFCDIIYICVLRLDWNVFQNPCARAFNCFTRSRTSSGCDDYLEVWPTWMWVLWMFPWELYSVSLSLCLSAYLLPSCPGGELFSSVMPFCHCALYPSSKSWSLRTIDLKIWNASTKGTGPLSNQFSQVFCQNDRKLSNSKYSNKIVWHTIYIYFTQSDIWHYLRL